MTQAVQTAQYGSSTVGLGFKNRLINGSMDIWQRGTSFTGVGAIVYYADRWCGIQFAGSTSTITRATGIGLDGFQYALRAQRPAASSNLNSINVSQSVESQNCLDIAGKQVTFSFYARAGSNFSAASSILVSQITTGTGTDQNVYGTYTGASTTNQNNTISTSWARFSQTITVPSNATEIAVAFFYTPTGTAGANDFYEITGCQLELGSNATSFDTLSIGTEFSLCERYFRVSRETTGGTAPGGGEAAVRIDFTGMRTQPTITIRNAANIVEAMYVDRYSLSALLSTWVPTSNDVGITFSATVAMASQFPVTLFSSALNMNAEL